MTATYSVREQESNVNPAHKSEVVTIDKAMIKYSDLRTRKIDLIIWCDTEIQKFGFATKGLKPSQLIFDSKEKAEKAARKMIKAAFDLEIHDGSLVVDSRLFFS